MFHSGRIPLRQACAIAATLGLLLCVDACAGPSGLMVGPAPAATAPVSAAHGPNVRVAGRVRYAGPLPKETTEYIGELNGRIQAHTVHVDATSGGLKDVAVWLEPANTERINPREADRLPTEPPLLDQRDAVFRPHVLAVRAGQPLRLISSDPGNHNIHAVSFTQGNSFNRYFGEGATYEHTFQAQKVIPPVKLICDLHHWMTAWIYVFDHPYYAITAKDGTFAIGHVPPGRYTLHAHHADGKLELKRPIVIEPGGTKPLALTLKPTPGRRQSPR